MLLQSQRLNQLSEAALDQRERGRKVRVAQFGLGMIGIEALKLAATKPWVEIVGAVDVDPSKSGRALGGVAGLGDLGSAGESASAYATFEELMDQVQPDVVLHTAGSKVDESFEQIEPMIRAGVSVVSSCEELLFPRLRAARRSDEIDALCRTFGAAVVGTGVNPGFVMDVLPICLTGVSRSVEKITVTRVVDASTRRMALQKKIGSGMDPEQFRALFRAGRAGHAGFQESAALICHAMGWAPAKLHETCEPVIAQRAIRTAYFTVERGQTCGLHQVIEARVDGMLRLTMDLQMVLDAPHPHDAVKIDGDPALDMVLNGGVAGDHATVAALVNAVPRIIRAGPGLHLMTDLALPSFQ